jgi:hypothetical protein
LPGKEQRTYFSYNIEIFFSLVCSFEVGNTMNLMINIAASKVNRVFYLSPRGAN